MSSLTTDRRNGISTTVAIKAPCACATTANITLSGEQTIDGVTTSGSRVLVWNQTSSVNNGIYLSDTGTWEREPDFDDNRDAVKGTLVLVAGGTTYANSIFRLTTANPVVFDSSSITFALSGVSDSANINFIQAGTGAVTRSVRAKLRETAVSVVDFGDDNTGVADSHAAFAAALVAADVVYVPPGTYNMLTQVVISGNKTITGPYGGTKATQAAIINVDAGMIGPCFYANTVEYGGICIQNLAAAGGNGDYFIEDHRPQSYFSHLDIEGTGGTGYIGNGIKLNSTGGGGNFGSWGTVINECKWVAPASVTSYRGYQVSATGSNCTVINGCSAIRGQIGINVDLCDGLLISNFNGNRQISGTYGTAPATANAAIRLSGAGSKKAVKIMTSYLEQSSYGVYVEQCDSLMVDTCWIDGQGNGDGGVFLAANSPNVTKNVTLMNNYIHCGKAAPASAVSVDGAAGVIIINNEILSDGTLSLINLGTYSASGTVHLLGNTFSPQPTNAYNNFNYMDSATGGTVASVPASTPTALVTLPGRGVYTVGAYQSNSASPAAYSASATVIHNGTGSFLSQSSSGSGMVLTLTSSTNVVNVTQTSTSTISVDFGFSRSRG